MMAILPLSVCHQQQHTANFVSYSFLKKLLQNVLFLTKDVLSSAIVTRKCTLYLPYFWAYKKYILGYKKGVRSRNNRWYARASSANNSCESLGCNKMILLYTYHQVILPYCTLDGRRHIICCIINHITIISTANNNKTLHAVQMAFGSRIGTASPKSGPTCFFVVFTGNASRNNVPNK